MGETRRIEKGDRVVYVAPLASLPTGSRCAEVLVGFVLAVSGASALVLYDGIMWPLWGPLERMTVVVGVEGQLSLL